MALNFGIGKKILTAACACALAATATVALTGCDGIDIVTNSEPPTKSATSALSAGATLEDGTLTVGINAENSPYGGTNLDGETVGLDLDVAAALADQLGCKLQIVDVTDQGKSALSQGLVDVALNITKTGSSTDFSYTNAYINDGTSLYCLVENLPADPADVATVNKELGKEKVIVQNMTAVYLEMKEAVGADNLVIVDTMKDAFETLHNGEAKYLAADAVIGDYFMRDYSDVCRINFACSKDVTPMYAVALAKNAELCSALNTAMESISSDGTLRVITAKWLGEEGSALLPGNANIESLPKRIKKKGK